jgi:hypothetical protein
MFYVRHVTKVMILFAQGSIFDIQISCQSTYGYTLLILNSRLHGVFPFLWSIREMGCIISMLGCDAHMMKLYSYYIINELLLSTTTLKREYTSEPMNIGPILIIINTFPLYLSYFIFSALFES